MEVMAEAKGFAAEEGWRVLDQHYDDNGLLAHEATVRELMRDCPGVTDVVCTTGTGATAAGLRRFLPEHIRVHARPGTQPWTPSGPSLSPISLQCLARCRMSPPSTHPVR